ncbi:MAG: hypothetical protein WBX00_18735 [Isosphaeraceae bacterium]
MRQRRGTIWTERALMVLFLAILAGALNLVMAVHRRAAATRSVAETVSTPPVQLDTATTNVLANDPRPPSAATSTIVPAPSPRNAPSPPPEDPTKKALAELAATIAQEIEAARQADRRTESLEKARLGVVAESERWRRREMLIKQQVSALADRVRKIDQQIDTLAAERDALAQERDALKAAVTKSQQGKGSYAVLPYKGSNGSWRRPIVMECSNGTVTLRPKGPTFSMLDLSSMVNPRSSPVILAMARELLRVQMSESPDGSPIVPYFVFLVRPDGIRPYYEIRARLEPLGIAFGYELIDQDLKVDVPDFDNLATWDGTIPLEEPLMPAPAGGNNGAGDGLAWPSAGTGSRERLGDAGNELAGRPGNKPGAGAPGTEGRSPDEFVWPSQRGARTSNGAGASQGSGTSTGLAQGPGGSTGLAQGPGGSPGLAQGPGGSPGLAQGPGGSPGLAQGPGGSPGLAQGPRPGSYSGGARPGDGQGGAGSEAQGARPGSYSGGARPGDGQGGAGSEAQGARPGSYSGGARPGDGQGGAGSEAGSDPALKPWPFPNQGVDQGASDSGGGEGAADSGPEAGSRPGSFGSGTGPRGARRDQGVALLPDLDQAGNGSGSLDPGGLAGGLSAAASGAPGQNGSPLLNGPEGSGSGSRSAQPAATGTEAGLAGTGDTNSQRPPGTGDVPPPGSATNPRLPGLKPDPDANTNSSNMAQDGSAGSANRSGPAGDLQAGAGLDSRLGSQASTSNASASASSKNASAGAVGSSLASMAGSASSTTSSTPGLVFGPDAGSTSGQAKSSSDARWFKSRISDGHSKTIEVPFEIVVVCRPDGAVIHPGGYLLTSKSLETGKKESILVRELLAVAQRRAESDPTIRPNPRVKFLVENGGSETFWAARKQILFSGLGWPMSLQVAGAQDPHILGKETW